MWLYNVLSLVQRLMTARPEHTAPEHTAPGQAVQGRSTRQHSNHFLSPTRDPESRPNGLLSLSLISQSLISLSLSPSVKLGRSHRRKPTALGCLAVERLEARVVLASDFGDAPLPYPTTLEENGPQHVDIGPTLGSTRDSEANGTHTTASNADGSDEDGVTLGLLRAGQNGATVTVNVQNAPDGASVNAWIDFNGDGNWGGPDEQIANAVRVVNGDNSISFSVPASARSGLTYARFRLSTSSQLGLTGTAPDGEVEDYQVTVTSPAVASGDFSEPRLIFDSGPGVNLAVPADVDGDGDLDILSSLQQDFAIGWHENDGHQNFTYHTISTQTTFPTVLVPVDLDGDQDLDFLFEDNNNERRKIAWYENDGNQNFTVHTITTDVQGNVAPVVVDMDLDGDLDILVPTNFAEVMSWLENDGAQNFTTHIMGPIGSLTNLSLTSIGAADFDGDGDMDAVSASFGLDRIAWYENDGHQNFTVQAISTTTDGPLSIAVTDVDGDGDQDVLSASRLASELAWYENDGHGQFSRHFITSTSLFSYALSAQDLDGDGDQDFLASTATPEDRKILSWFQNDGHGSFTRNDITTIEPNSSLPAAGDVDGDGDLDVISSLYFEGQIFWLENLNAVNLSVSSANGSEAGTTVITVTATTAQPVDANAVLALAISGTGITVGDYSLSSTSITISTGQTSGTVTFTVKNDTMIEGTETATITLLVPTTSSVRPGSIVSQTITITDDDSPVISSTATATVVEDTPASTVILNVNTAPTPSPGPTFGYSLSGPDAQQFLIDPVTGEITFRTSPDYDHPTDQDSDNVYQITVTVTANVIPPALVTQDLTISVIPSNDADPVFVNASPTFEVAENSAAGTIVGSVSATDADLPLQTLTYSLLSSSVPGAFIIDPTSGVISVANSSALNYESSPSLTFTVLATDSGTPARTATATVVVNLINVTEPLQVTIPVPTGTYHLDRAQGLITPSATLNVGDITTPDFSNAKLTVAITEGRSKKDVLGILSKGSDSGQISVSRKKILFGNTEIGTFEGGKKKNADLVVSFNSRATTSAVQNLIRKLTFYTNAGAGITRVISIQVTNISGIDSNTATRSLSVEP